MQNKDFIEKIVFLYIKDRKVLVARSVGKDVFYVPGGKRELGETDIQTLLRESKEELNINIDPASVVHWNTYTAQAHGKEDGVMVRAVCYSAKFTGEPQASSEIEEIAYLSYDQRENVGGVAQVIFDKLKAKNMID